MGRTANDAAERSGGKGSETRDLWLFRAASAPLFIFVIAVGIAAALDLGEVWNPPDLIPALNLFFLTGISLFVSLLAARSFLRERSPAVLLLGCGTLALGLGGIGASLYLAGLGTNSMVSVYNTLACVAGLCHLASAAGIVRRHRRPHIEGPILLVSYGAIAIVAALVILLVSGHVWPVYFVDGAGQTATGMAILWVTATLFGASAILLVKDGGAGTGSFRRWYGLGLGLVAVGLFGVSLQARLGDPLNWVGRVSEYVGMLYMLAAVAASYRDRGDLVLPVERALRATEEALRESNRKNNEILESIQDDFYVLDRDWKFVYASRQFTSRIGKKPEDFAGKCLWEMFPKHVGTVLEENFRAAMEKREVRRFEVGGKYTNAWYRMTAFPSAEGITVLGTDVTEQKRAEEALQESKTHLEAVIASMNDGVCIMDANQNITAVNEAFARFHRFASKEMYVKTVHEYGDFLELYALDGTLVPMQDWPIMRGFRGETASNFEVIVRRTDLGTQWYGNYSYAPILDKGGKIVGSVLTMRDITERKLAEEAQRVDEARFRVLIKNLRSGVALIDEAGSFTLVNPAFKRLFGLGEELDIMNVNSQEWGLWAVYGEDGSLLHVDDHPVRKAALTGKPVQNQLVAVRNPGAAELTWLLISAEPLRRADGRPGMVICTYSDVTERKRAEESLRESEERYRRIVETAEEGIMMADPAGKLTYVNARMAEMLGYSEEALVGMSGVDLIDPAELKKSMERVGERKVGQKGDYDILFRRQDGSTLWAHANGTPVYDEQGVHIGNLAMYTDITERKRAEEALRAEEAQFRVLISNLHSGVALIDEAGSFKIVNPAFGKLFGLADEGDLLQLNRHDGSRWAFYGEDGNPLPADAHPARKAALTGKPVKNQQIAVRNLGATELTWLLASAEPLLKEDGSVGMIICTYYDVTERKQAEEALLESKARLEDLNEELAIKNEEMAVQAEEVECANEELRANNDELQKLADHLRETQNYLESLFNYANAPIIVWDPQFTITRFNHAFEVLSGYTAREVIGKNLSILFPPESQAEALARIKKTLEGEQWESVEIPIQQKLGEVRIALWNSANVYGRDKTLLATIAQGQDITARKLIEQDLEEAKMQAELYLDLMGHDISNMHQIAILQLQLAKEVADESGQLEGEDLESIYLSLQTLERAARLIDNVRKLQKVRTGEYALEAVDLDQILGDILSEYARIPGRTIQVTYRPGKGNLVRANPLLKDVFGNLVDNAVKHSGDSVEIGIAIDRTGTSGTTFYRVAIEDNGCGIPCDKKAEVFQRFKRGQTMARGTGLGLYLVKNLVEGFGGYVEVQDRVLGDHTKGSRFLVYLPITESESNGN